MNINIILISFILSIISFLVLRKIFLILNLMLDDPARGRHKNKQTTGIPLLGGIYILIFLSASIFFSKYTFIELNMFLSFLPVLVLGICSDILKDFNPKKRFLFQIIFVLTIVLFFRLQINETGVPFLDKFSNVLLLNYIFTGFCILIVINGSNFIDGFNGISSSFYLLFYLFIYLVLTKTQEINTNEIIFFNILIPSLLVFLLFNLFGKGLFGDNGIYIMATFSSVFIILVCNNKSSFSPLFAVNLLWYPAFENLFSILRRLIKKSSIIEPDKVHLHSLIYYKYKNYFDKEDSNFINSLTGITLISFLLPNFAIGYFFCNNGLVLGFLVSIYAILYVCIYFLLKKNFNKLDILEK